MTVGVAYRIPGVGAVMVSDGRVTHDGVICTDSARKYVQCGPVVVLLSGTVDDTWRQLQDKAPRTFSALRTILADGDKFDWLAYDPRTDRLHAGGVHVVSAFSAIGSGSSLAIGALEVLPVPKTLEEAEAIATRAVRAACRHHIECGGRIRSVIVPQKSAKNG